MNTYSILRIGTRKSPLALVQANLVRTRLAALHHDLAAPWAITVVGIRTTGDIILDRPLAEIGGKGLFTKEVDEALLHGNVDLAVHSIKDMQTVLPNGLTLAAVLEREDPRDAFLSFKATDLDDLPVGAIIGTSSLRRSAQVLARRPDLRIISLRGNVQTRLKRLADGMIDATMLAIAGLRRLNLADRATTILPTNVMLPAVGQGAVGITCRTNDSRTCNILQLLDHAPTALCVAAERAFLTILDGSCRTPTAGLAELTNEGLNSDLTEAQIWFRGLMVDSVHRLLTINCHGPAVQAVSLGENAGRTLLIRAASMLKTGA